MYNVQGVCAGPGGGVRAVDSRRAGQSGWAAFHLHPVHQHLPPAPGLHHLPHGLFLEEDKWEGDVVWLKTISVENSHLQAA